MKISDVSFINKADQRIATPARKRWLVVDDDHRPTSFTDQSFVNSRKPRSRLLLLVLFLPGFGFGDVLIHLLFGEHLLDRCP